MASLCKVLERKLFFAAVYPGDHIVCQVVQPGNRLVVLGEVSTFSGLVNKRDDKDPKLAKRHFLKLSGIIEFGYKEFMAINAAGEFPFFSKFPKLDMLKIF